MNIGKEQEPVEVPVPVHPDDVPQAEPAQEPLPVPEPAQVPA